jgi:hypothetical protein
LQVSKLPSPVAMHGGGARTEERSTPWPFGGPPSPRFGG